MSIFQLNIDHFSQQLGVLKEAGQHFQDAKARFYSRVKANVEAWTDLGEIDQFQAPMHGSLLTINYELGETSAAYTRTILALQRAILDFEEIDEGQRQHLLDALAGLTDQFSYTPPEGIRAIMSVYRAAAGIVGTNPDVAYPFAAEGVGDADSSAGDRRADADRARAHATARRGHGHP